MGRGDKIAADQAAVDAMRLFFNAVHMDGIVVIGEGEKDQAPMLFNGERIGTGSRPEVDVAVNPIDGTRLVALGQANALSVVAVAARELRCSTRVLAATWRRSSPAASPAA